ncbi:unnamed protein product [Lymnaea stagnalis]|uniref:Uncharacterized protein n=1 Tax=Lymnaea stagnalis TaxID=6523 RepID=A0AAV2IIE8_LYMST
MASAHDTPTLGETEEEVLGVAAVLEDGRSRGSNQQNHVLSFKITKNGEFEGLPDPLNTPDMSSLIRHMSRLTGKIKVGTVHCTGFVQAVRQGIFPKCPGRMCPENHQNGGRGYILTVTTALHVVEKATDQCPAKVKLSWHQDGRPHQLTAHLCSVVDTDKDCSEKDWCAVEFITHNTETVAKLKENLEEFQESQGNLYREYKRNKGDQLVIIVSYPNGGAKQLSYCPKFYKREHVKYVREDQESCRYSYGAPTSEESRGAPVFILGQPLCGYGYWLGHPHIHSRSTGAIGHSSLGNDHVDRE